ncbi:carbonic anhydrase [Planctomicrobium piriforme]|uniref:Carbonic anhydrase n=1 Tax=Planctomicrobium piriforme TaxID=1576369 RepID=A0A1I3D2D3_9PLAN|nr:carbonic anhydrase [Planctomicrobium piriforme]SFH80857.1 carbonic anhydrase [Planctomicrobium piriforme]
MQKLLTGIHQFQEHVFASQQKFFERLADGQHPLALFITCSDSRISPNLLTQTKPGELFILRVAGNIIPPYGAVHGGEAATIEYAVSVLKVKDIIICGHSQCGAMGAILDGADLDKLPAVKSYLQHAESTKRIVTENYPHITDPAAKLSLTIEENVLVQLENLRTHPSVAAATGRGEVKLHGWVYQLHTGKVFAYSAASGQFMPLEDLSFPVEHDTTRELLAI